VGRLTVSDLSSKSVRVVELHDEFVDGDAALLVHRRRSRLTGARTWSLM
jgi:hypothetical protein